MNLFGTTTSPFTRRVRVVAAELGEPVERVETATPAGQVALREVSAIRKVPVAVVDGRTLYDSMVIIDWLTLTRGFGGLAPPRDRWHERNLISALDEALLSVVQVFYLRRDGIAIDGNPFATRQLDRADAIFTWLPTQLAADGRSFGDGFGLVELSVICALEWMEFRKAYPTERARGLAGVRTAWSERPSLVTTRPHE